MITGYFQFHDKVSHELMRSKFISLTAVHSHDTSMGTMEWSIPPSNGPTGALGSKCQTTKRQNLE
jgi:hypothetical protein